MMANISLITERRLILYPKGCKGSICTNEQKIRTGRSNSKKSNMYKEGGKL